MSRGSISPDPERRMGVYKTLADVPSRYRLESYAAEYEGRDVWAEFLELDLLNRGESERFRESVERAGRRWKAHMADRERHHALATPSDVDSWASVLLEKMQYKTAYNNYWTRIEAFYSWLQSHTEHPHTYHPPLMAAAGDGAASELWEEKMRRRRGEYDAE